MNRRLAAILLIGASLVAARPAGAEEDEAKAKSKEPEVTLYPVGVPIVVDGRLVNYVFVTIKLHFSPSADIPELQAKEPYFRDALIRAGGRTSFARPDSYVTVDRSRLQAAALSAARSIAGPKAVVSAEILKEQAQHYVGLPKPAAAAR